MTDRVGPVGPVTGKSDVRADDRRVVERRSADRRGKSGGKTGPREAKASRDLVPVGEVVDHPREAAAVAARPEATGSASAFAAQILGQGGQKRGLKGGPPVLDAARATYLNAEYSGENDRRPPTGKATKTEI